MNFDLTELAATLAIGVFSLVGATWAYLLTSNRTVGSVLTALSNMSQYFIAVIAACCFVVGMIIEDVSNKFVDDDTWLSKHAVLESDDEIKTKVFFGDNYRQNIHEAPISSLAARYGLLGDYAGADGAALESHILRKTQCKPNDEKAQQFREVQLNDKVSKAVAKLFYYNAKSFSYKDPSYYNELKKIQMRIDFSRSLIAVSVLFLLFFIAGLLVTVLKLFLIWLREPVVNWILTAKFTQKENGWVERVRRRLKGKSKNGVESPENGVESLVRMGRALVFVLMLGLLFFSASFAYFAEEREFDKRAYGYYIYSKINSERPAALICRELPVSQPQVSPGPATTSAVAGSQ